MRSRTTILLAAAAILAAFVPLPPATVERWYSRGVFPVVQNGVTAVSSLVPIALLDVSALAAIILWLRLVVRSWRGHGAKAGLRAASVSLIAAASVLYLLFLAVWGLNYRRLPLEAKLAYDGSRVTRDATFRFGEMAVERVNGLETASRGTAARPDALEYGFAGTQRRLGSTRMALTARPKRSVLSWYLLTAGIDGMMNPFFLEIILNPSVLPVEHPFTLAHEWAHLAGYADEAEANFVAWLTCVAADPASQYSGWLEAYRYASAALPVGARRDLQRRLTPEVSADLRAIAERLGRVDPAVSSFAHSVYDSYLRAQGVDEGIASYGGMLRLMVGTTFENGWVPRLRN